MENKFKHLWIPEEEVISLENKKTSRKVDMPIDFSEHGIKLLSQLETIKKVHLTKNTPVSSKYVVFKTKLFENQKISNTQREKFIIKSGLEIKYVKSNNEAIVAAPINKFEILFLRVKNYQERNRNIDFQYIDDFDFINRTEKQSINIRKELASDDVREIDVQIQLMPNFNKSIYDESIEYIKNIIVDSGGCISENILYLSDNTPVIRAKIDSSLIDIISDDDIVFRIEHTNFFTVVDHNDNFDEFKNIDLDESISIDNLPIVAILDSGVNFGKSKLQNLVVHKWVAEDLTINNSYHGTGCAARALFGNDIMGQIKSKKLKPRVRIIDGVISNGIDAMPLNIFLERIRKAVKEIKQYTGVFNLSFNSRFPIDGDSISIIGYELDVLMTKEDVQFIISAGNHQLYKIYNDLNDVIDDDDSRIASPADSALAITVGSYCLCNDINSISDKYDIAPYSRIGFGVGGMQKPDLVAPGGNVYYDSIKKIDVVSDDDSAIIPTSKGELIHDCGTSFAAPIVAGDFAIIKNSIPKNMNHRNLLTKALLYHNASPLFDTSDMNVYEKDAIRKVYGNGIVNIENSIYSDKYRVTFVRVGELNYSTKQRVKFYMPSNMAMQQGNNTCMLKVTCVSGAPFDKNKGSEYISAFISASLKKIDTKYQLKVGNPKNSEGRYEWVVYQNFQNTFSKFSPGDWQIWLEMRKRWDVEKDYNLPYALVVTIEDLTKTNDIYQAIQNEARNRFRPISEIRVRV